MKKLFCLFLAAMLSSALFAVGSSAADNTVKIGSPTVDGKLDDIYTDSLAIELGTGTNAHTGAAAAGWENNAKGMIYFLYDDEYLYACAVVDDNDVTTAGEAFAKGNNPYQNDNIEMRLCLDGKTTIKVGIDAYGYACYGNTADYAYIDYSTIKYKTVYTDTNYVIECAIPCTKGSLDMITSGKLGFKYQLNDLNDDGKHYNFAPDYAGEGPKGIVYYDLSSDKAEVAAPAPAPAPSVSAPATFDPVVIAAALSAISGAAFVYASKKR
ncbi:MAG: hypothetical protein IJ428_06745 [Clostridia bacterium]|nr:hypothetical protein [Clostridia bacterium]